jgi:hypothetical protein
MVCVNWQMEGSHNLITSNPSAHGLMGKFRFFLRLYLQFLDNCTPTPQQPRVSRKNEPLASPADCCARLAMARIRFCAAILHN